MILEIMDDVGAAERLQDFFGDVTNNNEYSQMLALHFISYSHGVGWIVRSQVAGRRLRRPILNAPIASLYARRYTNESLPRRGRR
jgi:hypothetical protein